MKKLIDREKERQTVLFLHDGRHFSLHCQIWRNQVNEHLKKTAHALAQRVIQFVVDRIRNNSKLINKTYDEIVVGLNMKIENNQDLMNAIK